MPKIEETKSQKTHRLGVRHVQAFLVFLCFVINFMSRLNVSFAVVAMTNAESTNPDFPEYNWNEKEMSYIISSATMGFIVSMIPGSLMCRRFGAKTTMTVSMLGSSILSLITPPCMTLGGWKIYCGIRLIQGLFQGLFFPCYTEHLAKWTPPDEITILGTLSNNGISVGTILAMFTSGFIAKSSWGWPGISYFAGGVGILWNVLWEIFADNDPSSSRFISLEEKRYILESQKKSDGAQRRIPIPWKAIFTSRPFLSLMVLKMASGWGYTTLTFEMPLYMRNILNMDIKSNAIYSSIPYLTLFVMSFVYLFLLDMCMKIKVLSLTTAKKIINTIAMWIPAAAFIWIGFLDTNQKVQAVTLLVVIVGLHAGVTVGHSMNTIELSPQHTGVLSAISFTLIAVVASSTPLFFGIVVSDQTDRSQWQIIFLVAGVLFFLGNLQYLYFGTTSAQVWNAEDFLTSGKDIESQRNRSSKAEDLKPELKELIEEPALITK